MFPIAVLGVSDIRWGNTLPGGGLSVDVELSFLRFHLQIEVFHKDNGLSENLLVGCKVVLRLRKVVLGLMSKCESISSKMVKQVTMVTERGTASTKQPHVLNSQ